MASLAGGPIDAVMARRLGDAAVKQIQRPVPLRERVYETLAELIASGSLRPDQHLVETELAELLGVSRQPVREALQWLHNEGWVDLRPGYGAFVHTPTEEEVDQLLAVRALLETEAARLAAEHVTGDQVAGLREIWQRGIDALGADKIEDVVAANAALHRRVAELSGNEVLASFAAQVDRRVRWYYRPVARRRGRKSWREHAELIDAVEAHDGTRAAEIMGRHTDDTRRSYHDHDVAAS
ncbi:MAG: GntR family transcriptional regulator [Nocardioidaceae bacterium]